MGDLLCVLLHHHPSTQHYLQDTMGAHGPLKWFGSPLAATHYAMP